MSLSTKDQCLIEIKKAMPDVKASVIEEYLEKFDELRLKKIQDGEGFNAKSFLDEAQDYIEGRRLERLKTKNEDIKDALKAEAREKFYLQDAFKDDPLAAIEAVLLDGEARQGLGVNYGVEAMKNLLSTKWMNQLHMMLDEAGVTAYAVSKDAAREIARALKDPSADVRPEAKLAADAFRAVYKMIHTAKRDAGAEIGEILGYIQKTTHNPDSIRAAKFDQWYADIIPKLDHDATFGKGMAEEGKVRILREVFEGVAEGHYGEVRGPGNVDKRITRERSLHFKDADSFIDYNEKYGSENLYEGLVHAIWNSARDVSLLQFLGSNPSKAISDDIAKLQKLMGKDRLSDSKIKAIWKRFAEATDTTRIMPKSLEGRAVHNATAITRMAKLGMSGIAQLADVIPMIAMVRSSTGRNILDSGYEVAKALMTSLPPGSQKKWLLRAGKALEDRLAEDYVRFGAAAPGKPGGIAKAQRLYFRANFMTQITEKMQGAMASVVAKTFGDMADAPFASLSGRQQKSLLRYGIDADLWEKVRFGTEMVDGERALSAYGVEALPDSAFGDGKAKREAALRVGAMIRDIVDHGVPQAKGRQRAKLLQGTLPDENLGMVLRLVSEFKSHPVTIVNVLKRIGLSTPAANPRHWKDIASGRGDNAGLAQYLIGSIAAGYTVMALYDLANGKEPKDPRSLETWADAARRGGAAGLYGDFIFGEFNKYGGRGVWEAVVGPSLSAAGSIVELYSRSARGEADAADWIGFAGRQVPFANLFYTKHAFDSLIVKELQDMVDPGHTLRSERASKQKYLLSPSELQDSFEEAME